ncbi:hypothetical protein BXY58_0613 [Epilithonimonas arachidiradicis]|uniref:Uncharacterized protein n=1 Tax=Epilithonimonas arachidiradicis TaxID=1617282 RepID=A0A420DDM0_9FLAO|nr:hypothetical protein BXY58_0613 [Epilithonimonas arachidiradicis]
MFLGILFCCFVAYLVYATTEKAPFLKVVKVVQIVCTNGYVNVVVIVLQF